MRKLFGLLTVGLLANSANALVLDFENTGSYRGVVSLGGTMEWSNTGGGHVYNSSAGDDGFIHFASETYVNSFEMTGMPWEDHHNDGDIGLVDIIGINDFQQTVWSTTVDLTNYTSWDDWFTVEVETGGIERLIFKATGLEPHYNGFWPSIDNLTINEPSQSVPEPSSIALLGLGIVGLSLSRRRKK